jgi:Allantoicase repeat
MGNFPQTCELHAINSTSHIPPHTSSHTPPPSCHPPSEYALQTVDDGEWTLVLPRMPLGPHREHTFQLENVEGHKFTHLRFTIHPDGGVKRVRVLGWRDPAGEQSLNGHTNGVNGVHAINGVNGDLTTNGVSEFSGTDACTSNGMNGTHEANGLNGNGSEEYAKVKLSDVNGVNGVNGTLCCSTCP